MKKIQVHARKEDYRRVEDTLEGLYFVTVQLGNIYQITVFTPDEELDDLIEKIRAALDLRYKENMIEVQSPDFVVSSYLKRAVQKAENKTESTPVEKLLDSTKPYSRFDTSKIALTSIAGLIALMGLFLDNSVIIIGAMLLSPIIGPIYAFGINITLGQVREALRDLGVLAAYLGSVLLLCTLATFLISLAIDLPLTDEIAARIVPNPIYILMTILLGFAAVLALTRGMLELVSGVAVAAALIPPVAVTGIVLVLDREDVLFSALLVSENLIGLMAGVLIGALVLHITPRDGDEKAMARKYVVRTALIIAAFIVLLLMISRLV
ncbi:MAG: TIGR00341 family protein [Methanomicrobiaceae archaeon]|uniref:Integral membrane protein n=1 Tax=hydrocarbon metagenome TaxID=938273 RepID=A0A0W8FDZ8_9ZZZZ|nr:TIGR00341 family protein [Methanomicrobiaceae archaeon]